MKTTTYNTNTNLNNINERKEEKTMKNTRKPSHRIPKNINYIEGVMKWNGEPKFFKAIRTVDCSLSNNEYWYFLLEDDPRVYGDPRGEFIRNKEHVITITTFNLTDAEAMLKKWVNAEQEYAKTKVKEETPATSENNTTTNTPAEDNGEKKGENTMKTYQKIKDNLFHNYLTMTPGTDPAPEYTEVTLAEKDILKDALSTLMDKMTPSDATPEYKENMFKTIKTSITSSYNHFFRDDDNMEDYLIIFKWAEQNYPATYLEFLATFRIENEEENPEGKF